MSTVKTVQLEQVRAEIINSNVCPDLAQSATQLVLGSGNPDADIVFIGEAPGKQEDITGEPFVGASGKFLNEMLASIGLEREDVYITNIVKYRPPNNRDPRIEEKEEFFPYLTKQLSIIDPSIVIPLGRHAMNTFLPDETISVAHGNQYRQTVMIGSQPKELIFVPLYHPAAALYNGALRQTLIDDFKKLPSIIASLRK